VTRKDFQAVSRIRVREATTLARNGHEQGAYYLSGVAVECALKACIAKKTKRHDFPPHRKYVDQVYGHDLEELVRIAGLKDRLDQETRRNPALAANWTLVKSWNVNSRYESTGLNGRDMRSALSGVDGVITWIRQHW